MTQHPTPPDDLCDVAAQFLQHNPDRCMFFVDVEHGRVVTPEGTTLGRIQLGPEYTVHKFTGPSVRQPIHVWAINGREYVGTYYKTTGNFARVKVKK